MADPAPLLDYDTRPARTALPVRLTILFLSLPLVILPFLPLYSVFTPFSYASSYFRELAAPRASPPLPARLSLPAPFTLLCTALCLTGPAVFVWHACLLLLPTGTGRHLRRLALTLGAFCFLPLLLTEASAVRTHLHFVSVDGPANVSLWYYHLSIPVVIAGLLASYGFARSNRPLSALSTFLTLPFLAATLSALLITPFSAALSGYFVAVYLFLLLVIHPFLLATSDGRKLVHL